MALEINFVYRLILSICYNYCFDIVLYRLLGLVIMFIVCRLLIDFVGKQLFSYLVLTLKYFFLCWYCYSLKMFKLKHLSSDQLGPVLDQIPMDLPLET